MYETHSWASDYHNLRALPVDQQSSHPTVVRGGQTVYRPLTFAENLQARITDARAHSNRASDSPSWGIFNDCCTAVIYGTDDKFKVQKISPDLLNLDAHFRQEFYQSRYNAITGNGVIELNRRNGKYNTDLTQDEVLAHPFWQFVADGNASMLQEVTQLQWAGRNSGYKAMAIWLRDSPQNGELRPLFVANHSDYSVVHGKNLNMQGSFLQVS